MGEAIKSCSVWGRIQRCPRKIMCNTNTHCCARTFRLPTFCQMLNLVLRQVGALVHQGICQVHFLDDGQLVHQATQVILCCFSFAFHEIMTLLADAHLVVNFLMGLCMLEHNSFQLPGMVSSIFNS